MAGFRLTARAEDDLVDIWTYIAKDNLAAADRTLDRIDHVFTQLATAPRMGAARPDIAPEMRHLVIGVYLALYREVASGVEIVRIVHGARDLPDLFRGS